MLIVRLVTRTGVTHNDRVCGSPSYVCQRRDQRGTFARKYGWVPSREAPRGETV